MTDTKTEFKTAMTKTFNSREDVAEFYANSSEEFRKLVLSAFASLTHGNAMVNPQLYEFLCNNASSFTHHGEGYSTAGDEEPVYQFDNPLYDEKSAQWELVNSGEDWFTYARLEYGDWYYTCDVSPDVKREGGILYVRSKVLHTVYTFQATAYCDRPMTADELHDVDEVEYTNVYSTFEEFTPWLAVDVDLTELVRDVYACFNEDKQFTKIDAAWLPDHWLNAFMGFVMGGCREAVEADDAEFVRTVLRSFYRFDPSGTFFTTDERAELLKLVEGLEGEEWAKVAGTIRFLNDRVSYYLSTGGKVAPVGYWNTDGEYPENLPHVAEYRRN